MAWNEISRFKTGKRFQDSVNPRKFRIEAQAGTRWHYSTLPGAGTFENEIDFNPERILAGEWDGWRVTAAPFHYFLGSLPDHAGDGWVGFGGRRGENALWFRLARLGFLYWPSRDWWDIGGAPNYDRANLARSAEAVQVETTGEEIRVSLMASWADLWATPGGGSVSVGWNADGNRLKEDIQLNQAGRDWIRENRNPLNHWPGASLADVYFGFVFQLDPADIPRWVINGILQDIEGDFEDGGESPVEIQNGAGDLLGFLPVDSALAIDETSGAELARLGLRKRIYKEGGNYYLLIGARADQLNALPAGALVFDPTIDTQVATTADDGLFSSVTFYTTNNDIYLGNQSGTPTHGFARFDNLTMSGTIDTAYISYRGQATSNTVCNLKVYGEDSADPAAPTSAADANGRSLTTGTAWNAVGSWASGTWYDSPDIAGDIQELVDSYTYDGSQAIIVFTKDNSSDSNAFRQCRDYTQNSANAQKLYIEYTESSGIEGSLAVTLADATLAATGESTIEGSLAVTLADATLAATGESTIEGSLAVTLADATLAATGEVITSGTAVASVSDAAVGAVVVADSIDCNAPEVALVSGSYSRFQVNSFSYAQFYVNVGSQADCVLIVFVYMRSNTGNQSIISATYDSIDLTDSGVTIENNIPTDDLALRIYYLENPTLGSNRLRIDWAGIQPLAEIKAVAFTGLKAGDVFQDIAQDSGLGTNPGVNCAVVGGSLVLGGCIHETNSALITGSGETEIDNFDNGAWVTSASYVVLSGETSPWLIDWLAGFSNYWAVAVIILNLTPGGAAAVSVTDEALGEVSLADEALGEASLADEALGSVILSDQ